MASQRLARVALLALILLPSLAFAADPPDAKELKSKVEALVAQLAYPAKQDAAEVELLKLGPNILSFLPTEETKLSETQKKSLRKIRSNLLDAQVLRELTPKLVTIQGNRIPFSEALDQVRAQTKMEVVDRRSDTSDDPPLTLRLQKATFWQALDAIAKEADLRVSLYDSDGKVALADGPFLVLPTSYSGVFRTQCKRLTLVNNLENDQRTCTAQLEIAWEPRFMPLFFESRPAAFEARDEKGVVLRVPQAGSGRMQVQGRLATEVEITIEAPRRAVSTVGLLKGGFDMIGPSKMLHFTLDNLAKIDKKTALDKRPAQTQEGVTVRLRELNVEPDLWTISFLLEYPDGGPEFESFQSWLVNNKAQLIHKKTEKSFSDSGYEIDEQASSKAIITYRFAEEKGLVLGKPEEWKLTYRTPGRIAKVPIDFEFKDLPLP